MHQDIAQRTQQNWDYFQQAFYCLLITRISSLNKKKTFWLARHLCRAELICRLSLITAQPETVRGEDT